MTKENTPLSENRNKKKKDLSRYYKQQDWMKPVGGALAIGGGLWFWLGYSVASYYGPGILIPVGMFLFFFDAARHIGTNEIEELYTFSLKIQEDRVQIF